MDKPIQPSDQEMVAVIADFLEQGLADNISSMFKMEPTYYHLVGELLKDERFAVRMGIVLVFEELRAAGVEEVVLAVPGLKPLLARETPAYIRGEAVTLLGMIGTEESLGLLVPLVDDDDPQVAEIARDFVNP
jgi:hypothetical protein